MHFLEEAKTMDQEQINVRRASWFNTIQACQQRPDGITAKQWLTDNRISVKSYYYWFRKFRKEIVSQTELLAPAVHSGDNTSVTFTEIPSTAFLKHESSAVVLRIGAARIELSEDISDTMLIRILKAVRYAG